MVEDEYHADIITNIIKAKPEEEQDQDFRFHENEPDNNDGEIPKLEENYESNSNSESDDSSTSDDNK